jgi:hypothetical protein
MAAWWNDLIQLWEIPDVNAVKPCQSGIHYAVKQAYNRQQLIDDIGFVLDRGLLENRAPAGYIVGEMRRGSVSMSYTRDERETLFEQGINPIVVRYGTPYVWGQQFHATSGQVYRIADSSAGLTPEFRAFISEPLLRAGLQSDPIFGHIGKRQPGDKMLAEYFKLKRSVKVDQEIIEITSDPENWGSVATPATAPISAQVSPAGKVHPLHRALHAPSRQIGLVTLGNRDL